MIRTHFVNKSWTLHSLIWLISKFLNSLICEGCKEDRAISSGDPSACLNKTHKNTESRARFEMTAGLVCDVRFRLTPSFASSQANKTNPKQSKKGRRKKGEAKRGRKKGTFHKKGGKQKGGSKRGDTLGQKREGQGDSTHEENDPF